MGQTKTHKVVPELRIEPEAESRAHEPWSVEPGTTAQNAGLARTRYPSRTDSLSACLCNYRDSNLLPIPKHCLTYRVIQNHWVDSDRLGWFFSSHNLHMSCRPHHPTNRQFQYLPVPHIPILLLKVNDSVCQSQHLTIEHKRCKRPARPSIIYIVFMV